MSFHPFWAILDSSEGLETELSNLFYITKIELIIAKIFTRYSCGPPSPPSTSTSTVQTGSNQIKKKLNFPKEETNKILSKGLQKPTDENHVQVETRHKLHS